MEEGGTGQGGGQPGHYRHRRGSRAPGAGGCRARAGRAVSGRTPSRPGRGSGGRGRRAGRSAPGGGRGPSPPAEGSPRGRLQGSASISRAGDKLRRGSTLERRRGAQCLPGHCGQHSLGRRTGSGQGKGGQRRARHFTVPPCRWTRPGPVSVGGGGDPHAFPPSSWLTSPGLPNPRPPSPTPPPNPRPPFPTPPPIHTADSPDSDTDGRGQRGGGSRPRWGTLSHQRHNLEERAARGPGQALLPQGHAAFSSPKGQAIPETTPYSARLTIAVLATDTRQRVGTGGPGADPGLAVGMAFPALAFLAGISGMREAFTIQKHLFLQDAVCSGVRGGQDGGTETAQGAG